MSKIRANRWETLDGVGAGVIYVDTVADLQALDASGLVEGQAASVQGSEFRWDGGQWVPAGPVNVRAFGALGDGETDDYEAFQDALWKAGEFETSLFVPSGRYMISKTLIIPPGVIVKGDGRYDHHQKRTDGTLIQTLGEGNPQRWTDIDGDDPEDDTPLFVAGGNGVYLVDISLLTEGSTPWSVGIFYPCVKQCGFERLQAFGFTDSPVYLDLTWSDRNETLKDLHPEIKTSTGMNEFYGSDFWLRGVDVGIKVQGTTRDPDAPEYGQASPDWKWGWGGASDVVFNKGRCTGIWLDAALVNAARAIQGLRFVNVDCRLGGFRTHMFYFGRCNRVLFFGGYGERGNAGIDDVRAEFFDHTGSIVFVGSRWRDARIWYNGVNTEYSLAPQSGRNLGGRISFIDWQGEIMNPSGHMGVNNFKPHDDGIGNIGSSSQNWNGVRAKLLQNNTSNLLIRGETGIDFAVDGATPQVNFSSSSLDFKPNGDDLRLTVLNAGVRVGADFRSLQDNEHRLGGPSNRWSEVFAGTGTINTSDAREKENISNITDSEKRVAKKIKDSMRSFKFSDSIKTKGESARIHFGVIAQDIKQIFEEEGLDPHRYSLFCYDEWEDQYEPVMARRIVNSNNKKDPDCEPVYETYDTGEKKLVLKKGSRYGIRYEELLCFVISAI